MSLVLAHEVVGGARSLQHLLAATFPFRPAPPSWATSLGSMSISTAVMQGAAQNVSTAKELSNPITLKSEDRITFWHDILEMFPVFQIITENAIGLSKMDGALS